MLLCTTLLTFIDTLMYIPDDIELSHSNETELLKNVSNMSGGVNLANKAGMKSFLNELFMLRAKRSDTYHSVTGTPVVMMTIKHNGVYTVWQSMRKLKQ